MHLRTEKVSFSIVIGQKIGEDVTWWRWRFLIGRISAGFGTKAKYEGMTRVEIMYQLQKRRVLKPEG